jgi:hypothetical protein
MSGELKVDGEFRGFICEVRFVGEQDNRLIGRHVPQCLGEIGAPIHHVIDTGEPNARTEAFNRDGLIHQNPDPLALKSVGHTVGIGIDIVIPQDSPQPVGCSHLAKKASTWFGGDRSLAFVPECWCGNEVAGKNDQVGTKAIHQGNRSTQRVHGKIWIVMKVAEQCDGEAVHLLRPTGQYEIPADDARAARLEQE